MNIRIETDVIYPPGGWVKVYWEDPINVTRGYSHTFRYDVQISRDPKFIDAVHSQYTMPDNECVLRVEDHEDGPFYVRIRYILIESYLPITFSDWSGPILVRFD